MPKTSKSTRIARTKKLPVNSRVVIITTLITAVVGLIGTIATVYIQDIYRLRLSSEFTHTADIAISAKTFQAQMDSCPQIWVTIPPTLIPVLIMYVNVDEMGVYSEKNQSMQPFIILHKGDAVEVLSHTGSMWYCITYLRDNIRAYGYALNYQLIPGYSLTDTAVANGTVAVDSVTKTATPTP